MKAIYEGPDSWSVALFILAILLAILLAIRPARRLAADILRISWTWLLGVLARHRPVALAVFSTLASATVSLALQPAVENRFYFGIASLLLVFLLLLAGLTPARYAVADLVSFMLPAVHHVLKLTDAERLTIHLLTSGRREKYEQLTEYYPPQEKKTRGRRFTFSHGIVAQVFKTRRPLCWSVLEVVSEQDLQEHSDESWKKAMMDRWSFDEPALATLTRDRYSFFAYPIGQEGPHARAVLFIDSKDPKRFQRGATCDSYQELIKGVFLEQLKEALRAA